MEGKINAVFWGVFVGGIVGFFGGVAWYEFVAVPKAATMHPMYAESYLCSAGEAPIFYAVFGAVAVTIGLLRWSGSRQQMDK